MDSSFAEALASFARVRVLVVGDLVADHYLYGQTERISREAPVLIVRHQREEVKLGGAANAAANARALGAKVRVLGVLGHDEMGDRLSAQMVESGISSASVRAHGLATETKTRVLAGGLGTTRQQMLRIDRGAVGPLPSQLRQRLGKMLALEVRRADVVLVSDYGAGVINEETRFVLLRHAAAGGLVCVDSRFALRDFAGATVCKPNEPELAAFTGMPVGDDASIAAAGKVALEKLGCEVLLVTRGSKGMALFQRGKRVELIPVFGSEEAVDVTGAGDTVMATFSVALGAKLSPLDAARLANVAGAQVVQKLGTATVTRKELLQELSK